MAYILNIETATKNCSVSLARNGVILSIQEINNGNYSHAEKLHPLIEEVLKKTNVRYSDLEAIAVSKGPGSYTGLRIGVSAAKGLCFALNIPLIAVNTLEALAHTVTIDNGYIVPMLDARRMEVYTAIYSKDYQAIEPVSAKIIESNSFEEILKNSKVYFVGDGAEKCKDTLTNENAVFVDDIFPSAREMATLSHDRFEEKLCEDVAYFEPFYLKDFMVTTQKKKV